MAKKRLEDYVKGLVQKGYDASAIRNFLLKYGYTNDEIDGALKAGFNPTIRHEIHLSHTTVFVIMFVFLSLLGAATFFYYTPSSAPTKLLDLNLEPVTTTVEPGQDIIFLKELSNLGSSKRYDVVIRQELIDGKTNKIVTQKIETRAIETFGSTQTKIQVPKDAKTGDYTLRAIVEYDGKKAVATLPIKVAAFARKESCFDGIKNQNEEAADCGGVCRPCEPQSEGCSDSNPCTNDIIENGACMHNPIIPCCGNSICEQGENQNSCTSDCKNGNAPSNANPAGAISIDDIKELAKTNPGSALQQCGQIEVPDLKDECIGNIGEVQRSKSYCMQVSNARIKDLCYSNVAKLTSDNTLCGQISTDSRRDSCYMTFVLDNKDYSVCDKLINTQLRQSCESLRQLNELNIQNQNQSQEQ